MARWMVGRSAGSRVEVGGAEEQRLTEGRTTNAAPRGFFQSRAVGVAFVVACVVLYGAAGALLFAPLAAGWKAGAVSALVVAGEVCFWLAAVVLGREVVRRYRRFFNPLNWVGGKGTKETERPEKGPSESTSDPKVEGGER